MQRLCDVCHGVYSNNSSFSAHQRKTGHKQIASVDGQQAKIVESSNDPGQLKDSLKGKDASIIQLEEKTKLHGGNKFCQLSQRFINFLTIFSHKRYTKSTLGGLVR